MLTAIALPPRRTGVRLPVPIGVAVAGALAVVGIVVGAAGSGPVGAVTTPDGPWGLWRPAYSGRGWFAVLAACSVCALTVAFVALYRLTLAGRLSTRAAVLTTGLWWLPVLPAPPLFSLDVYSYAAQGAMLLHGLDPYTDGPGRLGGPMVDAVAPVWRDTPAPYGPLSMAILRGMAQLSGGDLTVAVLLLRAAAVVAVVAGALLAVRLAGAERRVVAIVLFAANPLVIVHLLGGVHLDALLAALAAGTVLAVRHRRWTVAAVLAGVAFTCKAPGLVLVGYVLLAAVRDRGMTVRRGLVPVAALGGVVLGAASLVPSGWGWIDALRVPGLVRHPYDPATVLGWLVHGVGWLTGTPLTLTAAIRHARIVAMLVGAVVVAVLLWQAVRSRRADATGDSSRVGGALVTVALAAPTVHAWYATWGLAAITADASDRGRCWTVRLCVALSFTAMPEPLQRHPAGLVLIGVLLAVALAVTTGLASAPSAAAPGAAPAATKAAPVRWPVPVPVDGVRPPLVPVPARGEPGA